MIFRINSEPRHQCLRIDNARQNIPINSLVPCMKIGPVRAHRIQRLICERDDSASNRPEIQKLVSDMEMVIHAATHQIASGIQVVESRDVGRPPAITHPAKQVDSDRSDRQGGTERKEILNHPGHIQCVQTAKPFIGDNRPPAVRHDMQRFTGGQQW